MWGGTSLADQRGYRILFPTTAGMNPANAPPHPLRQQSRNASTMLIEDTLTWLRGKHSLSMGGSWTEYDLWRKDQQLVPNLSLGATGGGLPNLATGDPAQGMFGAGEFSRRIGRAVEPGAGALRDAHRPRHTDKRQREIATKIVGSTDTSGSLLSALACGKQGSSSRTPGVSGRT